ncbi:hypothetical protein MFFC18_20590 [Mariniblastus fucicola]|uniref:Uncharacterized protein n=1 Tax=Mariniblastus fucicola TaxID=980251 RepID=A0A5B9P7B2_9BACT|nr:hypothetical protein MFFC18_20590 [Mariniblastus fucicola]
MLAVSFAGLKIVPEKNVLVYCIWNLFAGKTTYENESKQFM